MFNALEVAIEACRLAANNEVYHVVIDIGQSDIIEFGLLFNPEMEANAMSFSTIEEGKNFNEVIVRGVRPA